MISQDASRKTYLDILRIFAAFLVCYNHSHAFHLYLSQDPSGSIVSWINVFLSVLTTVNIPLFFMISGALLLAKEESYKTLFSKRIARFALLTFFASLITYILTVPGDFSVSAFVNALLQGKVALTYWYLYAYLAFLIALPFLRKIAKHLSFQDFLFLLLLRFFFVSVFMIVNFSLKYLGIQTISLSGSFQFPFAALECLFYPISGYYLAECLPMEKINGKHICLCTAVLLGGSAVSSVVTYLEGIRFGFSQTYIGLFNYSSAMCVFLIVRYAAQKIKLPDTMHSVIASVSSVTIGIYLMEPIITHYLMEPMFRSAYWHAAVLIPLSVAWCLFCMVLGGTMTYLLRKLPFVHKIL